jgi:hypothetical protein
MRIRNFNKCQEKIGNAASMTKEYVAGLTIFSVSLINQLLN